jgi:hypothetical protein
MILLAERAVEFMGINTTTRVRPTAAAPSSHPFGFEPRDTRFQDQGLQVKPPIRRFGDFPIRDEGFPIRD